MQRDRNKAVTAPYDAGRYPVRVLPPYVPEMGGRWALEDWQRVHVRSRFLKPEDLDLGKLSAEERNKWGAAVKLAKAFEKNDHMTIEEVWPRVLGNPPDVQVMVAAEKMPGPSKRANLLAAALSKEISRAQLMLLWQDNRFVPTMVCPDLRTALYVQALQGAVRICPHCDKSFVPKRPDQGYCSIPCREAHRVARWRLTPKGKRALKRAARERKSRRRPRKGQATVIV